MSLCIFPVKIRLEIHHDLSGIDARRNFPAKERLLKVGEEASDHPGVSGISDGTAAAGAATLVDGASGQDGCVVAVMADTL